MVKRLVSLDDVTGLPEEVDTLLSSTYAPISSARLGNLTTAIGDSLTQSNDVETGIQGATQNIPADSWFTYANLLSGQRIRRVRNVGIGGNTSAAMLARFQADVIDSSPDNVIILAGTNDIGQTVSVGGGIADADAFATFRANIAAMVTALRAAGIVPILATILPSDDMTRRASIIRYNAWLDRFALENSLILLDFYSVAVDPATGGYLAATAPSDQVHIGVAGQQMLGQYTATTLAPFLPPLSPPLSRDNGDPQNMIPNGLLLGGALNGSGIPPGWQINSGFGTGLVVSLVTDSLVPGNLWQVAATASSGAYYVGAPMDPSKWSPGDVIAVSGVVTSDGGFTPTAALSNQSGVFATAYQSARAITRGMFYCVATIPAGSTSLMLQLNTQAPVTGTAAWGQVTAYNRTRLGIVTP